MKKYNLSILVMDMARRPAIISETGPAIKNAKEAAVSIRSIGTAMRFAIMDIGDTILKQDAMIGHVEITAAMETDMPLNRYNFNLAMTKMGFIFSTPNNASILGLNMIIPARDANESWKLGSNISLGLNTRIRSAASGREFRMSVSLPIRYPITIIENIIVERTTGGFAPAVKV
jgi:hypothetical protein